MFERIAGVYDAMNTIMTAGLHHRWRERAADLARVREGDEVLDVATGTGDLAVALARRVGPSGNVIGADFAEAMLERARTKARAGGLCNLSFCQADALALPFPRDRFAAATVAFGARNFADLPAALEELVRVVRPGGRVVILEITQPQSGLLARFFSIWFDRIVPALGRLARSPEAYDYLPRSVRAFLSPRELAEQMHRAGLEEISYLLTAGGIIAIHAGTVP
jgi:demethylmenaquinone methyltransferase/2-methoxy-6-polyprenyl-1,4-benzoquinol methylase